MSEGVGEADACGHCAPGSVDPQAAYVNAKEELSRKVQAKDDADRKRRQAQVNLFEVQDLFNKGALPHSEVEMMTTELERVDAEWFRALKDYQEARRVYGHAAVRAGM